MLVTNSAIAKPKLLPLVPYVLTESQFLTEALKQELEDKGLQCTLHEDASTVEIITRRMSPEWNPEIIQDDDLSLRLITEEAVRQRFQSFLNAIVEEIKSIPYMLHGTELKLIYAYFSPMWITPETFEPRRFALIRFIKNSNV